MLNDDMMNDMMILCLYIYANTSSFYAVTLIKVVWEPDDINVDKSIL